MEWVAAGVGGLVATSFKRIHDKPTTAAVVQSTGWAKKTGLFLNVNNYLCA